MIFDEAISRKKNEKNELPVGIVAIANVVVSAQSMPASKVCSAAMTHSPVVYATYKTLDLLDLEQGQSG